MKGVITMMLPSTFKDFIHGLKEDYVDVIETDDEDEFWHSVSGIIKNGDIILTLDGNESNESEIYDLLVI